VPQNESGWGQLSPQVLRALGAAHQLDVADTTTFLAATYGAGPNERFVEENWPALREQWLAHDTEARHRIVDELRLHRVGKHQLDRSTLDSDLQYLRTCSNARRLRDIVLGELLQADPREDHAAAGDRAFPQEELPGDTGETELDDGANPDFIERDLEEDEIRAYAAASAPSQFGPLQEIAAWAVRERSLDLAAAVWSLLPHLRPPGELLASWQEFLDTPLVNLADWTLLNLRTDDLVREVFDSFDGARSTVLHLRILTLSPVVLDECGRRLGITRERVRQIQKSIDLKLTDLLSGPRFLPLRWRASDLADLIGAAAPAGHATTTDGLRRAVRDVDAAREEAATALLLRLAGPYRLRDGWYLRAGSELPKPDELDAMSDENGLDSNRHRRAVAALALHQHRLPRRRVGRVKPVPAPWRHRGPVVLRGGQVRVTARPTKFAGRRGDIGGRDR